MNRRIKTEESTKSLATPGPAKRTRATAKNSTIKKTTKKAPKKRLSVNIEAKDSSSDEEFKYKCPTLGKNSPARKRVPRQTSTNSLLKSSNIRRRTIEKVYQISDSDTDDDLQIGAAYAALEPINLCETDNSITENKTNILDEIICNTNRSEKVATRNNDSLKSNENYVYPSTSRTMTNTKNKNEMPNFINNLLCSNEDLLDESYLTSFKELNEQTDKLLASSWDLINNDDSHKQFEESVIYVCTEKEQPKTNLKENNSEAAAVDLPQSSEEKGQKIKPQCPICLETLGSMPVSSTICGHIFCTPCIENCIKCQKKCPTCRKKLTLKMMHPLFLF